MSDKVKIGIIGVGTIGSVHADAYAKVNRAEVIALCDILPDRLKEKGARHGVETLYADYNELLANSDIEAVSVCVPNNMHAPIAIAALDAGKDVLLEKPMALNAQEGQAICDARDRAGKVLQMGMVQRQSADGRFLKEVIDNGQLGEIYQMRVILRRRRGIPGMGGWFTTKALSGGGGLIDIGVHFFDLSMWLSGCWNPTRVSAKTYTKFGSPMENYHYTGMWAGPPDYNGTFDVDDYACGFVRFGETTTMNFEVCWAANSEPQQFLEILGDKGGIRMGSGTPVLLTEVGDRIADVKMDYDNKRDNFAEEMRAFIAAIKGEAEPAATAEEGVIIMKLIDAIYRSSAENAEVAVG